MTHSVNDTMLALYRHSASAVITADTGRSLIAMNPAAEHLFGYSEDEILGKNSQILYADPRDYSRLGQTHFSDYAENGGEAKPYRTKYRTKDGRVFDGETIGCPVIDRTGATTGFMCIINDVTHRLALQAKLEASDIQLRAALASANEGAFSLNLVTGLGSTRGFVNEFMGLTTSDATISLDRWRQVIHDSHRPKFDTAIAQLRRKPGSQLDLVFPARRNDGVDRWLQIRGRVSEFARDGSALRLTGVISDITERQELERKLAERERQLANAITAGACGAWEVDLDTLQITPIGEVRAMLGIADTPVEIDSAVWLAQTHEAERESVRIQLVAMGDGGIDELDATYRLRDNRTGEWRWIRATGKITSAPDEPRVAAGVLIDITDRKRLHQRAEESEWLLKTALEAAGEGAWRLDLRTLDAAVTGVLSRMMGLGDADAATHFDTWFERVHEDDGQIARDALNALREGTSEQIDFVVRYSSAEAGQIRLHNRGRISEWDADGKPAIASGFMTDLTEFMETTETLAQREQLLSDAVEASTLAIWRFDADANRIWLRGDIVAELFGSGEECEISGEKWRALHYPEDLKIAYESLDLTWKNPGKSANIEFRLMTHSGEWRWYRASGRRPVLEGRDPARMTTGVIVNIDAVKREDQAVREERARFERIYNATPAMLNTMDVETGEIVQVSDFWLQSLGYDRQAVIGKPAYEFLDEESRKRALDHSLPLLRQTGVNENIPYRIRRKDGAYMDILLSSFLVDEQGRQRSYAVMTDVTPLRAAYEQLQRSNKELDRFATVASHDLQEPLRKISAFAALVRRRYADQIDSEGVRSLDFLVDAAQRMQSLIDDLLAYSKMASQPLRLQRLDLNELVEDVLESLETSIRESRAEIRIGRLPRLRGDPLLLRQTFQNLISNAVKYRADRDPIVDITFETSAEEMIISIRDNGIGFDSKFAEKVFAPFQRLHNRDEYQGTGIGLAIVRQSVERHGGRIDVVSEPGKGSTFRIALPVRMLLDEPESADVSAQ